MILYSELITWIVHTSLFSFWFTGLITVGLLDVNSIGILQGFVPKYLALILAGFTANFAINGFPKLLHKKESEDNLILVGEFKAGILETIDFLLQGSKVKNVIRNLVQLTGKKNVFRNKDRITLFINNADTPKMYDYIIITIQLSLSILLLISSPALMVLIFLFVKYLLILAHITPSIAGAIVKTLTMVVFGYYLYTYLLSSSRYSFRAIRYVTKPLGKHFGYSTFSSPLLAFINSNTHLMGAADPKNNIYINDKYIENNTDLVTYIVAHEAGHLNDKILNFIKVCLSPVLFPWLVFIMISLGVYFSASDNAQLGNSLKIIGVTTLILTTLTSLNIQKLGEFRADEYAVRKLGVDHVKRILQELSSKGEDINSPLSSTVPFSKRLERIMSKKWKN